jgi:hypothetical protein
MAEFGWQSGGEIIIDSKPVSTSACVEYEKSKNDGDADGEDSESETLAFGGINLLIEHVTPPPRVQVNLINDDNNDGSGVSVRINILLLSVVAAVNDLRNCQVKAMLPLRDAAYNGDVDSDDSDRVARISWTPSPELTRVIDGEIDWQKAVKEFCFNANGASILCETLTSPAFFNNGSELIDADAEFAADVAADTAAPVTQSVGAEWAVVCNGKAANVSTATASVTPSVGAEWAAVFNDKGADVSAATALVTPSVVAGWAAVFNDKRADVSAAVAPVTPSVGAGWAAVFKDTSADVSVAVAAAPITSQPGFVVAHARAQWTTTFKDTSTAVAAASATLRRRRRPGFVVVHTIKAAHTAGFTHAAPPMHMNLRSILADSFYDFVAADDAASEVFCVTLPPPSTPEQSAAPVWVSFHSLVQTAYSSCF